MGLHCHQPVDNFKSVFEEAYNKSYEPFLSVLERHPRIKLSLHYSGSLLDWIVENKPDFVKRIKKLIEKEQIEILGGGYFEPILPMVPADDAKGQIGMLTRAIEKHFGYKPSGIWLTERVWDPALTSVLDELDIKYTIVDEFHLKQAGIKNDKVFGHYSMEGFDDFSVFASIKKLRYTMPFREPHVTIDFLKEISKRQKTSLVTFGDDCEKFGLWPHTYDWVYKKGWLEKFFGLLEENDFIRTLTFSEALREYRSMGQVEIPHSSYPEMIQWCNGSFDNFFKKYGESDLMRKRMLYISRKLKDLKEKKNIEEARKELYKSQASCAYWHGIFGGIYTPYLRQGVYKHLIKSEEALQGNDKDAEIEMISFPSNPKKNDKKNIICARNKFLTLFIDPDYAGSIFEIDYKPLSYNLINTMSRRYEPYHEKLKKRKKTGIKALKKKVDNNETIDLYEVLGVRERNLKKFLNYDPYRKFSVFCHAMDPKTSLGDFIKSTHADTSESSFFGSYTHQVERKNDSLSINLKKDTNVYPARRRSSNRVHIGQEEGRLLRLNKCIILEKDAEILIKLDLENISTKTAKFIFGIEFNWSIADDAFMRPRRQKGVREIALLDKFCGLKINHIFEKPVNAWSFPVYTLNETEKGLGKTFQEISLLFHKKLLLKSKQKYSLATRVRISG
ncbi:MAG: DUF1926 domain-containing protein [Candidatus Omnitrophica bacterium]|nr:DUF1926 domain-containing protein [Candidatus Omnitrophota bacterium]